MDIIPINLPLDLPAPLWLLKFVLIGFFLLHILFINFMIGGAFWSVFLRMLKKEDKFYERFARDMANTVTVNKSIAVVLGVAPLLAISLAYTSFFYPANNITAPWWLSIIWLVGLAFVSLFIYKYTWDSPRFSLRFQYFWGLLACAIFLLVPFIFLANINLMLYPDQWKNIYSFWSAIWVPNVIPRYLHFMNASFAIAGIFAFAYFHFKGRGKPEDAAYYTRASRLGLKWALYATLLQLLFGVLNYLTLPQVADSVMVLIFIICAVIFAGILVYLLLLKLYADKNINLYVILATILIIVSFMVMLRHFVRENALEEPKKILTNKTALYQAKLARFMSTYSPAGETKISGEFIFQEYCTACHAINKKIVGPPMTYAIEKYKTDRNSMIEFIDNPRKIDENYPVMPKQPVSKSEIELVVDYLLNLEVGSNGK
ncbi:c-type cytochrome [candidate division KSB1 bacterium]|nr:c-type cytochrome [candidate division KSB1 bacterium]